MKRLTAICAKCLGMSLLVAGLAMTIASAVAGESVTLAADTQPILNDIPRIGLNLGGSSTWGADQLSANILKNPGFEAPLDRSLLIVKQISGDSVSDDAAWLARPDGFWTGARFEVRTGRAAGSGGMVLESHRQGKQGAGVFTLDPLPIGLLAGDAIAVSIQREAPGVPMWWIGSGRVSTTTSETRPGSPGRQAARLIAAPGSRSQLNHHLDTISDRAGKLLPLRGLWQLQFWARGTGLNDLLDVRLARNGSRPFLHQEIKLTHAWKYYEFNVSPDDNGPAGTLNLSFEISGGEALLDDLSLAEQDSGGTGFRPAVLNMLKILKPGYLRDWQGQLGDSLENRLATPFARRPVRYRPGDAEQMYLYSLPEFLQLCAAIGAQPWVIAPPLMNDSEWSAMGVFLAAAARQYGFREILLEFGNENWNEIFRPAGFLGEARQAEAADRAFRLLKAGAGSDSNIITLVNAQFVNPASWGKLAKLSQQAARVAVAPYFLHSLAPGTEEETVAASFQESDAILKSGIALAAPYAKRIAVYEVNFHTTEGKADNALRNLAVSGAHSGAALARRLLQTSLAGVREQAVYSFAGFDSYTGNRSLIRLWGLTRDLAPGRLRPTGLALSMLNQVVNGELHATLCQGSAPACASLTAAWFHSGAVQRLAVVSASDSVMLIKTQLACKRQFKLSVLDGSNFRLNNEEPDSKGPAPVAIRQLTPPCKTYWQFELPPHSLAVFSETANSATPQKPLTKTGAK